MTALKLPDPITLPEYTQAIVVRNMVHPIFKPGSDALRMHWAMGMLGEPGEVVDVMKKAHGHGRPLDPLNFAYELGDVTWYLTAVSVWLRQFSLATHRVRMLDQMFGYAFGSALGPPDTGVFMVNANEMVKLCQQISSALCEPILSEDERNALPEILLHASQHVCALVRWLPEGTTIGHVMALNRDKLLARHPDGFKYPTGGPRVYVISKFSNWEAAREVMVEVRERGGSITFDWTVFASGAAPEDLTESAEKCTKAVRDATHVLLLPKGSIGASGEAIATLVLGKPLHIVGAPPQLSVFDHHPQARFHDTVDSALASIFAVAL